MEIASYMVNLKTDDVDMPAFLARPEGEETYPAVIVIHEVFGLVQHIKDVAGRFAREGYLAIAPDLFFREGAPGEDIDLPTIMRVIQELPDNRVVQDLKATIAYLKDLKFVRRDKIGIIGFCMGGTYSLLMAGLSRELAASAVFYGRIFYREKSEKKPTAPIELVPQISCPLLLIYGEADMGIPMDDVRNLEESLRANGKGFELKTYPGAPHAFFNDTRETYRPEAAEDAWKRTLAFFDRHLKAGS